MTNPTLEVIKTRRVIRVMTDEPIAKAELEQILEATRWAPVGGNQRFLRFVAVEDPLSLGINQSPPNLLKCKFNESMKNRDRYYLTNIMNKELKVWAIGRISV